MRKKLGLLAVLLAVALGPAVGGEQKDIVDTAVAAGNFKTLAKLLTDAELVGVMKGPGPYTVFAPTDDAFAKVPKETLDALVRDKARLQAVLTYHVLTSSWTSDDVKKARSIGTAQGQPVSVGVSGGMITINNAKVVKPDIACANGVIHVIDAVLLPK